MRNYRVFTLASVTIPHGLSNGSAVAVRRSRNVFSSDTGHLAQCWKLSTLVRMLYGRRGGSAHLLRKALMRIANPVPGLFTTFVFVALAQAMAGQGTDATPTDSQGAVHAQAAVLGAQASPESPDRITIDVLVSNNLNHLVPGLEEQDFALLDNTHPQKLIGFHAIDARSSDEAVQILFVMDMINVDYQVVTQEREQLNEFLSQDGGKLSHRTSIAVMTENDVSLMNSSGKDGLRLMNEFKSVKTNLRMEGRTSGFYGAVDRLQESLRELQRLIDYEAKQPGRKLVLVIGPGWPFFMASGIEENERQRAQVYDAIARLTNSMRTAHIALYSLNPFPLGRTNPFRYQDYLKGVSRVDKAEYPYLALQVLAEHSGGRALVSGRDILGEIETAMHDAGPYYELTFAAPVPAKANEYHELRVRVDKPGLTVRTAAAYYAEAPAAAATSAPGK